MRTGCTLSLCAGWASAFTWLWSAPGSPPGRVLSLGDTLGSRANPRTTTTLACTPCGQVLHAVQLSLARARDTQTGQSASQVYLLVYPIPDELLRLAYAARAAQAQRTAAGLEWRAGESGPGESESGRRGRPGAVRGARGRGSAGEGRGAGGADIVTVGYVSADFVQHPVSLLFQV